MRQMFSRAIGFERSHVVAHLYGELDSFTAQDLLITLAPLIQSGRDVVVNISGLSFLGTTALVLLDRLAGCTAAKGGSLCLANPSTTVRRLLEITRLAARFTVHVEGAIPSA